MLVYVTMEMGRIEEIAGCWVATRFRALNGFPLVPLGGVLVVHDGGSTRQIPIPGVPSSILAAYARVCLPLLAGASFVMALAWFAPLLVVTVLLALASVYVWGRHGHLSASERRKRLAYATWMRAPVDIGWIPADVELPFEAGLVMYLDERATAAPETYRERLGEQARWRVTAIESSDPELLVAALTRARLERRKADGAARAELDALHRTIWEKLDPLLAAGKTFPAFEEWRSHVAERDGRSARYRRQTAKVFGALGAVGIPITVAAAWIFLAPELWIVNASDEDGMTVLLDGKPVAEGLPTMGGEDAVEVRVRGGSHELVTRDAAGKEIDRRRFDVPSDWARRSLLDRDTLAFLYAPARASSVCFFEELVTYSAQQSLRDYEAVRLDMADPLHRFSERIDYWFKDAPEQIEVRQGDMAVQKRTVRVGPCQAAKRRGPE